MTATFLLYADDKTVDDYSDFFMYRNWRDQQLVKELDPEVAQKMIRSEDLKTMEEQFNEVQGRYASSRWTSLSAEAMARVADEHLPEGFKVFTFLYASIYRQISAYVHSDVRSIQAHFRESAEGVVQISQPVSKEHCGKLMHAANFLMLTICFVVTGTFYGRQYVSEWNTLVRKWNGTNTSEG